ncbi:MAG TPA: protein kinase [Gemmatimonadaceae bacterium]|nr:protein kinase [Gemmatimonadaceae bacterium]
MDLRARLQSLLEADYAIERELGGGGMSRVFVAMEKRLGRRVVIKVLSSELAATLSTERFEREIRLAASLQQANIVPVLTAGIVDGTPFYTMPYVEGESLRGRLSRGALSEHETLSILRDVARALVYAHERGVVHRDIKPDNVLLSGEAAVVTDFGIAKAINAARAQAGANPTGAITQLGTALGTPAYMAPEQVAGDPSTDHRADLYAFGCMGFELLTGSPPFHGLAPHKLMAAHLGEAAPLVSSRRADVNPVLDALITACLAKLPEDRPANAREVLRELESAVSGSSREALPASLSARQWSLPQALGVWAASFAATWILARAAVVGIGLPSWTVTVALVAAAFGAPAVLLTWYVQRSARRALLATPQRTPGGTQIHTTMATLALRASPHVSWTRTWRAGAIAGGVVVAAIGVVMILRVFGMGPAASLLAAGRIGADSRVLVAEFASNAADTSLGSVMAQAMRTSLGQSKAVKLVTPQEVSAGFGRMVLPASSRLDERVARDFAVREGIPLVVMGQLATVGSGFLVSARLVSADSGVELAAFQRGANGAGDLLDAIDHLARDLRARIGESLRTVQRAPALEQVTTSSLAALREYTRAVQLGDAQGDFAGGLEHLAAAVREDSTFAQAWRKIGAYGFNAGRPLSEQFRAAAAAYRFRNRLAGDERAEVDASYLLQTNTRQAVAAYRAAPGVSRNNEALVLVNLGENAAAESVAVAEIAHTSAAGRPSIIQLYTNLLVAQIGQGKIADARHTLVNLRRDYAGAFTTEWADAWMQWTVGGPDSLGPSAERLVRSKNPALRAVGTRAEAALAGARGQLRRYSALSRIAEAVADSAHFLADPVGDAADVIVATAVHMNGAANGVKQLDSVVAANPSDKVPVLDRRELEIAAAYAQLGRPEKAKPLIVEFERVASPEERLVRWGAWQAARGEVALAEGRATDALVAFRVSASADTGHLEDNVFGRKAVRYARAFDRAGQRDSAIAHYEQYASRAGMVSYLNAPLLLPTSLRRLGELYEAKGDITKAIEKYEEFVKLWQNADPELQPQVVEIRERVKRLRAIEAKKR